jgi:predicted RNase H-like HicB family nuclease
LVRPLARLALVADGKRILVRASENGTLIDATADGQIVISFAVAPIAEALRGKVSELQAPRHLAVRIGPRSFQAVLTPDLAVGGYSVEVPELPGVITEADTIPEARRMIADAIRLWLGAANPVATRKAR